MSDDTVQGEMLEDEAVEAAVQDEAEEAGAPVDEAAPTPEDAALEGDAVVPPSDDWSEQVAEGEDFDETLGEARPDPEPRGVDDEGVIDEEDTPDGFEDRDEEVADDDPADVPDEHGGTQAGIDTDGNGIDDTVLPEGTDSVVDESGDWE